MFKPNGTRIYATKVEATQKAGAILLPGSQINFGLGVIVAIGDDVTKFAVGDKIAFGGALEFKGEGCDGFLMEEADVLGKFEAE